MLTRICCCKQLAGTKLGNVCCLSAHMKSGAWGFLAIVAQLLLLLLLLTQTSRCRMLYSAAMWAFASETNAMTQRC